MLRLPTFPRVGIPRLNRSTSSFLGRGVVFKILLISSSELEIRRFKSITSGRKPAEIQGRGDATSGWQSTRE